ncbi:hypothetical protein [Kineococcus sp. NPDC059986]|uniref:hypothetical protein n=1 Tax=Kineococcus sp. NPDC059986 TaxID=3155538 RepID=UPI00344BBD10
MNAPPLRHAAKVVAVFDTPELVLHEHEQPFSHRHQYEVLGADGTALAAVEEELRPGFLGHVRSSRSVVLVAGDPVLFVERPGGPGRQDFHAVRPDGTELGRVRQENSWGAPRFELATLDGVLARLTGGAWGGREWTVTLHADPRPTSLRKGGDLLGGVQRRPRSLRRALVDADEFVLRTDPTLERDLRALLLVGVIALDFARDLQKSSGD